MSEQIHPWDKLACCWDVKQATNERTVNVGCKAQFDYCPSTNAYSERVRGTRSNPPPPPPYPSLRTLPLWCLMESQIHSYLFPRQQLECTWAIALYTTVPFGERKLASYHSNYTYITGDVSFPFCLLGIFLTYIISQTYFKICMLISSAPTWKTDSKRVFGPWRRPVCTHWKQIHSKKTKQKTKKQELAVRLCFSLVHLFCIL